MYKALIVEDETEWQEILTDMLEDEGFYVIIAETFKVAIEILVSTDKEYQNLKLITLDLGLDDSNHLIGMDLLEFTNKHWHQYGTRVIIITGKGWDREAQTADEFPQVIGFIPKAKPKDDLQEGEPDVDFQDYFLKLVREKILGFDNSK